MNKEVNCPNCGEKLSAPVEIESVLRTGNFIKVNFVRSQVTHTCPGTDCHCTPSYICEAHSG